MNWSIHKVKVFDKDVFFRWHHGGNKCTIVFVHGLFHSSRIFHEAPTYVHDANLIAVDLPGFGFSDATVMDTETKFADILEVVLSTVGVRGKLCIIAHSIASTLVLPLIKNVSKIIMIEGNLLERHLIIAKQVVAYTDAEFQSYIYKLRTFGSLILRIEIENISNSMARYLARDYKAFDSVAARSLCELVLHQFKNKNLAETWTGCSPKIQVIYGSKGHYAHTICDLEKMFLKSSLHCINGAKHYPMICKPRDTYETISRIMRL